MRRPPSQWRQASTTACEKGVTDSFAWQASLSVKYRRSDALTACYGACAVPTEFLFGPRLERVDIRPAHQERQKPGRSRLWQWPKVKACNRGAAATAFRDRRRTGLRFPTQRPDLARTHRSSARPDGAWTLTVAVPELGPSDSLRRPPPRKRLQSRSRVLGCRVCLSRRMPSQGRRQTMPRNSSVEGNATLLRFMASGSLGADQKGADRYPRAHSACGYATDR